MLDWYETALVTLFLIGAQPQSVRGHFRDAVACRFAADSCQNKAEHASFEMPKGDVV